MHSIGELGDEKKVMQFLDGARVCGGCRGRQNEDILQNEPSTKIARVPNLDEKSSHATSSSIPRTGNAFGGVSLTFLIAV